jgi:hypothetical protein
MSDIDGNVNRALLADYEWNTLQIASSGETKQVETIVDVGGAEGAFLSNILSSPPNSGIPHGILYDLASNIAAAKALWTPEAKTVRGELKRTRKIELVAGDFFRPETIPLPKTLDTPVKYVLRQILHDWSDSESLRILRNFRLRLQGYRAVAVVLVEVNRPASEGFLLGHRRSPGDYSSSGHLARPSGMRSFIDGQMMVCCNGKERAPEQWREIFQLTGWRLVKQVQTRSVFSVMELQMDEAAEGKGPSSSQEGKSTQKEEL